MNFDVKVDLSGLEKLIQRSEEAPRKVTKAMADAILADALERVPRDSGELAKSGHVEMRKDGSAAVIFGNSTVPYALVVHESPEVRVVTGEKFFLRNAAMERKKIMAVAAKAYRKALGLD